MEKNDVAWEVVVTYKGKDGYGYGTTQTKTVKKEFKDRASMLDWITKNDSIDDYSGYNVTTRLYLSSYKTYKIECVESYENGKSYRSFESGRCFDVGDSVLHMVSDTRITSPLRGVVKSIFCGRCMDVEFDGYGTETFDFGDPSVYKE